jgi:hypothetical protein
LCEICVSEEVCIKRNFSISGTQDFFFDKTVCAEEDASDTVFKNKIDIFGHRQGPEKRKY